MFIQKWKNNCVDTSYTYKSWDAMRGRCLRSNDIEYPNYGGRGITICERWVKDYDAFVEDMGFRPEGMTIERIDVNGNYEPDNCKWATAKEQGRNRRNNQTITFKGKSLTMSEWSERLGIGETTIEYRLSRKMPVEKVLQIKNLRDPAQHGSLAKYSRHKCRCEKCADNWSRYWKAKRMSALEYDL